ncbi:ethanolamine ammonia-lyase subunit EutC [Phenylobacterium sp.]|uniref:ethanolamine ammonia-lyase subunit EutC n=1 Tax=Phenylobacterium sp. TaxID=1871053 RepID=UPI002735B280|nr:ethanolamine ammonia-lyase subunit EutC [Phenylobacterium sp.]MDP3634947.1 ethanolamine ammonia-lyase subunit EutC [Phenylobacterium sp.]
MGEPPARDPWTQLTGLTAARIALGRAGPALPTREVLALALAHAQARDAVHAPLDADAVARGLEALGHATVQVASAAPDRATYLRRPDLGRRLSGAGRETLERSGARGSDLVLVVADGLSSAAAHAHAVPLVAALAPYVDRAGWSLGPVVIATQARVALGDEIGERLGAGMVALLVGERPGLSSPDSLGIYLTHAPHVGRTDAERNCISNIRPEGLSYDEAAFKLAWHIAEARRLGLTGVGLKDESDLVSLTLESRDPLPPA